jgi:hypothetical protein
VSVTGAEVVEADLYAKLSDATELLEETRVEVDDCRFGELEMQVAWMQAGSLKGRAYDARQVADLELTRGEVDRDGQPTLRGEGLEAGDGSAGKVDDRLIVDADAIAVQSRLERS